MAGFQDLVALAQPALYGDGVEAKATEGQTWKWTWVDVTDDAGDAIDLSTVTGTCKVYDGDAALITLNFAGAVGTFTVSATKAATAGLAGAKDLRQCRWGLELDDTTDSLMVWAPPNSAFTILSEDGVA